MPFDVYFFFIVDSFLDTEIPSASKYQIVTNFLFGLPFDEQWLCAMEIYVCAGAVIYLKRFVHTIF